MGDVVSLVLAAVACALAAWALSIRKALVDRSYRSRALWTAIGALTVVAFAVAQFYPEINNAPTTYPQVVAEFVFWGFIFLGLYGWLASNANVAVGADYFNRDILFWKKGGRQTVMVMIVISYVIFNLPPWWFSAGSALTTIYTIAGDIGYVFSYAAIVYVIIIISISYRRILDRRIKTYTLWVALSMVSLLIAIFVTGPFSIVPFVALLYFLYRSVGALAIRTKSLAQS